MPSLPFPHKALLCLIENFPNPRQEEKEINIAKGKQESRRLEFLPGVPKETKYPDPDFSGFSVFVLLGIC